MKKLFTFALLTLALVAFAATGSAGADASHGGIYTETNAATGNGITYFARSAGGALTAVATYYTGGLGTGANLGSQGAVVLDGNRLFAVNAGSNSISEFQVRDDGLRLTSTFPSGGLQPTSLTIHNNVLYVLDAGSSLITGFRVDGHDGAQPIAGSTQALLGSGPAEAAFTPDGSTLLVTEKTSNTIDRFAVARSGRSTPGVSAPSAGGTPFGFAFDAAGRAFVSEAAGSASSYAGGPAGLQVITSAAATHQGAPCWLVVTPNGRFAYTANAAAGTISGFAIAKDGSISLLDTTGITGAVGAGSHPLDEVVSPDGRYLYVLADLHHAVSGFAIGDDGSLAPLGEAGVLPAGAVGIAAS